MIANITARTFSVQLVTFLVMKQFLIAVFLSISCAYAQETCSWNETASYFLCRGLDDDSGDFVKNALQELQTDNIEVLRIEGSQVTGLPSDLFQGYKIGRFECYHTIMTKFPFDAMLSLGDQVSSVDIDYCTITTISRSEMASLPFRDNVKRLHFTKNTINDIQAYAFASLSAVTNIEIELGTAMSIIEDYAFANISKLQDLLLAGTTIYTVPQHTFWNLPSLQFLDLSGNPFATLVADTFTDDSLPNISQISFFDVPFYCNCSLQWLKDFLNEHLDAEKSGATCIEPEIGPFNLIDFCSW